MAELYANKYIAYLQNALAADADDTTLIVNIAPPAKLQAVGNWRLKLADEIMLVTNVDPDGVTLTVVRAIEDTILEEHVEGSIAVHSLTADSLFAIIDDQVDIAIDTANDASEITFDPTRLPTNFIAQSSIDVQTALEDLDARTGMASDDQNITLDGTDAANIVLTATDPGLEIDLLAAGIDIQAITDKTYIFGNKGVTLDAGSSLSGNIGIEIGAQNGDITLDSSNDVNINASGDININVADKITITAADTIEGTAVDDISFIAQSTAVFKGKLGTNVEAESGEAYMFGFEGVNIDSGNNSFGILLNGGDVIASDKVLATGGIGVGNAAAATNGVVVNQAEIFDELGVSIGFIPIYDTGVLIIDGGGP